MPIYEYQCSACAHEFEALQKISDAPLQECPACQRPQLKKKISAAGFRLAGGGWYETDFKKGGKQKNLAGERDSGGGDKGGASESKSTDAAKSEKPASTPAKSTGTD